MMIYLYALYALLGVSFYKKGQKALVKKLAVCILFAHGAAGAVLSLPGLPRHLPVALVTGLLAKGLLSAGTVALVSGLTAVILLRVWLALEKR